MRLSRLYLLALLASYTLALVGQSAEPLDTLTNHRDTIDYKSIGEVIVVAPTHNHMMRQQPLSATSLDVKPLIASMGSLN